MPRWKTPDLPQGTLHVFNRELHSLHRKAGYPSARAIQKAVGGKAVVSHTTIHHAFIKPARPNWGVVELVVEALAKRSRPRVDPEAEVDRFKALWDAVESDVEGDEHSVEQVSPRGGGSFDPWSLSASLSPEAQELVQELQRIKDDRNMTLDVLSRGTSYPRSYWHRVLKGQAVPPRGMVLELGERMELDTDRLLALWDMADRARKASVTRS